MGEMTDKAKGLGNEIAGNIKQAAGKVTHNQHLEAEGIAKNAKAKPKISKAKSRALSATRSNPN
jgi:uncharacterized protein YjbJ (UPF0337 family)